MIELKKMSNNKIQLKFFLSLFFIICVGLFVQQARADVAQVPLFLTDRVDPNIMFILDDSGSMQWEHMPDHTMFFTLYVFPRPANLYGGSVYNNQVPDFDDANLHNVFSRSPENNAVFYNPMLTYTPWVDANNNPFLGGLPDGNVDPTAAPYNPADLTRGTLGLTIEQTQSANWFRNITDTNQSSASHTCGTPCNQTFWPITFYRYIGVGDRTNTANYIKYQIRGTNAFTQDLNGGAETPLASFVWTEGSTTITRTVLEERQNFANWFSYYRSRILASRAGIGRAFASQGENMRVGSGAINVGSRTIDNVTSNRAIIRGVRAFSGANRATFFDDLYTHTIPTAGTPLRRALEAAGQYYSRPDNSGPWGAIPGTDNTSAHLVCRQSYTILMTDGFWNGPDPSVGNSDNLAGPEHTNHHPNPDPATYQYAPSDPFQDSWTNTLADVAMHYWKNDLRTDLDNQVPKSAENPAFWQHMVTFGVGLGVEGTIDPAVAFSAIETASVVNWPDPFASNPAKLDDLLHAGVNSRGGFFSAADPDTFATELSNTLINIMARTETSAAAIATNSTRLVDGSLIYQARFDSNDWSGELRAYQIADDGSVITSQADWIAYHSPGPTPPYLGWSTADSGKIPAHGSRSIYTWTGSVGTPFTVAQWAILDSAQRLALQDGGTEAEGQSRLNWIRGDSSNEDNATGLRERTSVLGDIVNSNPLIVGVPNLRYERLPTGTAGRDSYLTFRQSASSRPRMLYVGANDGMLHAFDAATGEEKFAYVPAGVYSNLAKLTKPDYPDNHIYLVDGSAATGDAYIAFRDHITGDIQPADWRTILVGTLGAGGKSVFALDVTNPNTFSHHNILWELTDPDLGYAIGQQPAVARLQNGQWAAIFSNGYDSTFHRAVLFIVNLETGVVQKIDTGVGDATNKNGLSSPSLLLDSQRTLKAVYAGDLQGNLWKFDLSDPIATNWNVAYAGEPLFKARNSAPQVQPITAPLVLGEPQSPGTGVMVYFGTGKYFEVGDNIVTTPQTQSFYGIFDNGSEITEVNRSTLVGQSITSETTFSGNDYRETSNNTVDYSSDRGWYIDFLVPPSPGTGIGERVVSAPLLRFGRVVFTTLIPSDDPCSAGGTGWLMLLDALSGARPSTSAFGIETAGNPYYSGIRSRVGIIGTPAIIRDGTMDLVYMGGSDLRAETEGVQQEDIMTGAQGDFGRRSWRQLQ